MHSRHEIAVAMTPRHADAAHTNVKRNVAPQGVFGTVHKRPSWASMIDRQIDRPIPIPLVFVV